MECLKTYDDSSGGYKGIFDQSIVHGWDVEVCRPAFLCENQWQYHAYDNSAWTHLTRISKNNVVRIDWSDMSTILTCLWHLWTEGPAQYNGIKKLLAPRAVLQEISMLIPLHQIKRIIQTMRNRCNKNVFIVLIFHWLGTHSLLKAFSSSKCYV